MKIKPINSFRDLVRESIFYGAKIGLTLGAFYVVFFTVSVFIIGIFTGSFRGNPIATFVFGTLIFAVMGTIIGIVPSIVVGMITSLTISTMLWILKRWLSTFLSIAIGVGICYAFIKLVDYTVWSRITDRATGIGMAYYSWRGLPTLIYIATGGYMSWKLFKAFNDKPNDTMHPADSENNVEVLQ
jgi:hypothetical protein